MFEMMEYRPLFCLHRIELRVFTLRLFVSGRPGERPGASVYGTPDASSPFEDERRPRPRTSRCSIADDGVLAAGDLTVSVVKIRETERRSDAAGDDAGGRTRLFFRDKLLKPCDFFP